MKKIFSILGSLLFITAVKAQTTVVKKETVNPGSSQITGTAVSSKDPKAAAVDPKKEEAERLAAQRAAKDAKVAQHVDPKKEEAERLAAQRAAKDAKVAQHVDPKKEAEQKAAAEREAKNANTQHKQN